MTRQDIDLQKIQILESSYQGWFNFKASLVAGTIVGILILFATLSLQNILNLLGVWVGYAITIVGGLIFVFDMKKDHEKHMSFMNGLLLRIEKGEKLESIEELRKMHEKRRKLNSDQKPV